MPRRGDETFHGCDELRRFDRLRDVHLEAGTERADAVCRSRIGRECNRRYVSRGSAIGSDPANQGVAVFARHLDIADDDVRAVLQQRVERRSSTRRGVDNRAGSAKDSRE